MADKLGLGTEVRELKLGPSFSNNKSTSFHTIRYDFKPASVDLSKVATVDVGSGNQVTVTVPHLDGAGTSHTVFKGSQRPYQKECVLIIDRTTGEITLEKLTNNIQVKKTRMEAVPKVTPSFPHPNARTGFDIPTNVPEKLSLPQQRPKNKKKTSPKSHQPTPSLSGCIPRHSPLHASPPYPTHSPTRPQHKSPPQSNPPRSNPMPPSLPVIGMDDISGIGFGNVGSFGSHPQQQPQQEVSRQPRHSPDYETTAAVEQEEVGIMPDSSSSDSSSDSASSDSDSEPDMKPISRFNSSPLNSVNGHLNGTSSPSLSMPDHLLKEDLQLSESGSESD